MLNLSIFRISIGVTLLLSLTQASAIAPFLDDWRAEYPDSSSGDIRCQLCHLERDGGDPWNAYGNDIRRLFNDLDPQSRTIEQAFRMAESLNSDNDSPATSNLDEIDSNQQPAWREGRVNLAFDRNGEPVGEFFPPLSIDPFPEKIASTDVPLELNEIAAGFTAPLGAEVAPVLTLRNQLFLLDQIGIVWRVDLTTGAKTEYLNLTDRLVPLGAFQACGYDERGLLGLAFHPQFASNGRLYIHTSEEVSGPADFSTLSSLETANHQSVIRELVVGNPTSRSGSAQIESERVLIRFDQPQFNHNGGALVFDDQALLYIGLGDGGGADDQGVGHGTDGNGSDPSNPFGAILRIDPLGNNSANGQYGIPATNPFLGDPSRLDEIYAYGFRNPWKLSFDDMGRLFAADVGQNDVEEINIVESGQHYGWRVKEGRFFFDPNDDLSGIISFEFPDELPPVTLVDPVLEYDHDEGISVTGGYVYRGTRNPSLRGKYLFGDFTRRLFLGDLDTGELSALNLELDIFVYSLAEDAAGELYVMGSETIGTCDSQTTGKLIQLKSTAPVDDSLCLPIRAANGKTAIICL